jgi:hypothetical protein
VADIIQVLRLLGEIDHWRRPAAPERGGNPAYPPVIAWRYRDPSPGKAALIRRLVASFRGTVRWEFRWPGDSRRGARSAGSGWVLMPARLRWYAWSRLLLGELEAAHVLTQADPNFGRRANAELPFLAEHIQRHPEQHPPCSPAV